MGRKAGPQRVAYQSQDVCGVRGVGNMADFRGGYVEPAIAGYRPAPDSGAGQSTILQANFREQLTHELRRTP
jgi:hypothetical protein